MVSEVLPRNGIQAYIKDNVSWEGDEQLHCIHRKTLRYSHCAQPATPPNNSSKETHCKGFSSELLQRNCLAGVEASPVRGQFSHRRKEQHLAEKSVTNSAHTSLAVALGAETRLQPSAGVRAARFYEGTLMQSPQEFTYLKNSFTE